MAGSITALVVIVLMASISFYEKNHSNTATTTALSTPLSTSSTTSTLPSSSTPAPTSSSTSNTPAASTTPTTSDTPAASVTTSAYKDGTYSATSNYYVPHGVESIKVTLTLKSGVVTDSSVANSEGNNESASYQQGFAQEYRRYVVGKNITDVKLSYVAGASDTTNGFNDAVSSIISQSQS